MSTRRGTGLYLSKCASVILIVSERNKRQGRAAVISPFQKMVRGACGRDPVTKESWELVSMQGTRRRRFVLGNLFGVSMLRLCIYKVAASSRDQMPLFLRQTVKHSNRTDTLNNYISSIIHTYIYPWDISSTFSFSPQLFYPSISHLLKSNNIYNYPPK